MIMKDYSSIFLFAAMHLMFLGCSVLEDRDGCPSRLLLDFTRTDTADIRSVRVFLAENDISILEIEAEASEFYPEYGLDVPRKELHVNVSHGDEGYYDPLGGIIIPKGCDCPEIFMHSSMVDAREEFVKEEVRFRKNHCNVTLYLEKEDPFKYEFCIKGNVNGYGFDGKPHTGNFIYNPVLEPDNSCRVVLPRQVDSSLILEIDDGSEVLKTFALGEYIENGGYDWSAPDLEDLTVHIDWAMTSVNITVSAWDWVYECEIVI